MPFTPPQAGPLAPITRAFLLAALLLPQAWAAAPQILTPPQPAEIYFRESAILSVETAGEDVSLQWYNGQSGDTSAPIPGATGPLLVSQPMRTSHIFWVRASNADGHTDSPAVPVTMHAAPKGTLKGMGTNQSNMLFPSGHSNVPKPIMEGVIAMAAGVRHNLVLKDDFSVWAMGDNSQFQIGSSSNATKLVPERIGENFVHLAAGSDFTLMIAGSGTLYGFGVNDRGQIGTLDWANFQHGSQIAADVVDASAGLAHTAYVTRDGTLWARGANSSGQLGDGSTSDRQVSVAVASGVARVYAGNGHTFFLKTDGSLWGTGHNEYGQLGDGSRTRRLLPFQIAQGVISAACGGTHSFYITRSNELHGMGATEALGLGEDVQEDYQLSSVVIAQGVKRVACGFRHSLFITTDGILHTTGSGSFGQLGDGTIMGRLAPVTVGKAVEAAGREYQSIFIDAAPVISDQPDSMVVRPGKTASFSVLAQGSGPLSYQWYVGLPGDTTQPLAGATTAEFTTPPLRAPASYWVRITSPHGYTDSVIARVLMFTKVTIKPLPKKLGVPHLGNVVIKAEVTGPELSYQWYQGKKGNTSQPVPGATSTLLVTPPLPASTSYWLRATNTIGHVDSSVVAVTVAPPLRGTLHSTGLNNVGQLGDGPLTRSLSYRPVTHEVSAIAADLNQSFFIKSDGSLWGMGENTNGELGDGSTTDRSLPVPLGNGIVAVASRSQRTFYLKADGSLWGSGRGIPGYSGQFLTSPAKIGDGFASIHNGTTFSLALKTDGTLWGEGGDHTGQLGQGDDDEDNYPAFMKIADGVVQAAAGTLHSLFIKSDGSLWGMGYNTGRALGLPDAPGAVMSPTQIVPSGVTRIAAGRKSLFLKQDGSCWGMGGNLNPGAELPAQIATKVIEVAAGEFHVSFLTEDNELWVIGANGQGQLGDGTNTTRTEPTFIHAAVAASAAGHQHSLILTGNPVILEQPQPVAVKKGTRASLSAQIASSVPVTWQWYLGESGDTSRPIRGAKKALYRSVAVNEPLLVWARVTNRYGHTDTASVLIQPVTKPLIASIPSNTTVSEGDHAALPVSASGGVLTYTWYEGTPGNTSQPVATIDQAMLLSRPLRASTSYWVRVSNAAGFVNSGAIPITVLPRVAGTLMTAGRNQYGQLGNNSTERSPVRVPVASGVVKTVGGVFNTYYLKDDGTLWGMGYNHVGQLGTQDVNTSIVPIQIASDVIDVIAGNVYLLFIKSDGSLWGTGYDNHGQLGQGSQAIRWSPVQIATNVVQAAAGEAHTIFVKSDGTAWATGRDTDGEQGNGTDIAGNVLTPAQIATGVAAAAAGEHHTLLLKCDGTLWAAGLNSQGQLGDGSRTSRHSFVPVGSGIRAVTCGDMHTLVRKMDDSLWTLGQTSTQIATGVESMAAGVGYSLYLTRQGELYGWGNNENGQLGNGSLTYQATPVLLGTAHAAACGDYHSALIVQEQAAGVAANATGRTGTIPDPDGDSDGDGLSNLIEHAFASDTLAPGVPPYTLALQTTEAGSALVLTHRRAIGAAVDFIYEWSDDLADWQAFTPQLQVQPVDAEVETVIATRPIAPGEPAIFLRVRVREK
jgi:alpha-tubulin suppressor-like RCC1 family protein